jgi:hypothetical protein
VDFADQPAWRNDSGWSLRNESPLSAVTSDGMSSVPGAVDLADWAVDFTDRHSTSVNGLRELSRFRSCRDTSAERNRFPPGLSSAPESGGFVDVSSPGEVGEYARGCGGALMHRGGSSNSTGNSGSSGVDCSAVRRAVPS